MGGHAPLIFYNVTNWYSGGWDQIRYPSPYDAFAVEWNQHTHAYPKGCRDWTLVSVQGTNPPGYEAGTFFVAVTDTYSSDCSPGDAGVIYASGARRYANCGDPTHSAYSASLWPTGRCPDLKPDPEKGRGIPTCPVCAKGDPVNPTTGNKFELVDLIRGSGTFPLQFSIAYNGKGQNAPILAPNQLSMGARRVHSLQMRIVLATNPVLTSAYVLRPDGKVYAFDQDGQNWLGDPDVSDRLTSNRDETGAITSWVYTRSDNTRELYDASGKLTSIVRQDGFVHSLVYDAKNHLQSVTDPQGRSLVFSWDTQNRIIGVQSADGNYAFNYDANNNLTDITYPDSSSRHYIYGEHNGTTNFAGPNDLTGQVDEMGHRVDTTTYLSNGSVGSTASADGVSPTSFVYSIQGRDSGDSYAVTDGLGVTEVTSVGYKFGVAKPIQVTRTCSGCTNQVTSYTYDANGRISTKTDGKHVTTATTYDATGLLTRKIEAQGLAEQRTTDTTWNSEFRAPLLQTTLDSSENVTQMQGWSYNATGKTTASCLIDPSKVPSYTCSSTGVAPLGVRRTVNTYCTAIDATTCPLTGLLLTIDGPRTDVTDTVSYSYYLKTDESGCAILGGACHHLGDLKSTTDGAGLSITFVSHDKAGRPTRVRNPNGILTDYTYSPRGWLATKIVRADTSGIPSSADAITTIVYDPTGTVHSVQDPDGVTTTYTYDAAHRLTDITDANGARIHYTLDAASNRTNEQVLTSTGTVTRSLGRTFNPLGQLTALTDGLNRTVFAAGFADSYDGNGNLVHSQDGLSVQQKQSYDGLNRLVSTIRDYQGTNSATANTQSVTSFDALDRVTGFSDPDGLNTTYDIDAFGNITGLHSPDTGTTTQTFDISGNPLISVNAANVSTASTYDVLGRLSGVTYPDTTLNVTYRYDEADAVTGCAGSFAKGHLTRIIENNGGLVYCYDAHGNVVTKQQTVGMVTTTTRYTWTAGDRLSSVNTANRTTITYARDTAGRITAVVAKPLGGTAITVASNVVYQPLGTIASYTLGNGQTVTRTYDANGQLTDIVSPALSLHFTRDPMGNITAFGGTPGASPASEIYGYDPLYRLTTVNEGSGNAVEASTYNKTGDRLSKTGSGVLTGAYSYQPGTHHLLGVGATTREVDARGNTTANILPSAAFEYDYNQRNRLAAVQNDGITVGTYVLNALGQRVQKTANEVTTRFDYDEGSHILSETMGSTSRDYVWIDDIPVGVVDHNASVAVVNFIHADGLGSPRVVTDGAGVAQWKWPYTSNPFGEHAPVSTSGYTLNLRFPGQYFDAESGLSYNVNRDYEAATGRYVQADPIGLAAGSNIYSYVSSNPLAASDSMGLQESPSVGPGNVLPGNYDSSTIGCDGMGGITVFIIPRSDCTDACDMRHELSHIKDALALNATVCSHQPIRTSLVFMPWSFLYDSEARAYAEGIKCLEEKLRAISDCDQCRAEIEKAINLYSDRLRRYAYAAKNP